MHTQHTSPHIHTQHTFTHAKTPDVSTVGTSKAELVGTALKSRIEKIVHIKAGETCRCRHLASQMDIWGIEGCEARRGEIIGHLVANRDMLVDALRQSQGWLGHMSGLIADVIPDIMLRAGADWLLTQAIEDVRSGVTRA